MVQLSDIQFKHKTVFEKRIRIPFADRSNFRIMSNVQMPAARKTTSCITRSRHQVHSCCVDMDKLSTHPETIQLKELKVILKRCENVDLCILNKTNVQRGNFKINTAGESNYNALGAIKQLWIKLSPTHNLIEPERSNEKKSKNIKEPKTDIYELDNIENGFKLNSAVESTKKKVDIMKELWINLYPTPNLIEIERPNQNKPKRIKEFNTSKVNIIENDVSIVNVYQCSKDNLEHKSVHCINNIPDENIFSNNKKLISNKDIETLRKSDNFASTSISNTPIIKKLRKREKKNYLETSETCLLDKRRMVDILKKKVPIYKQFEVDDTDDKKDPYELDISDTEEKHSNKCRRNLSEKFDKTMYEIIQKLERKQKIKKRQVLKKRPLYDSNIKSVLHRVMKKVDGNKNPNKNCNKPLDTGQMQINLPQDKPENVQNSNINPQNAAAFNTLLVPKINDNKNPSLLIEVISDLDNEYIEPASPLSVNSDKDSFEESSSLCIEFHKENEIYFGFDDNVKDSTDSNKRINLISNITMRNGQKSPWRLDGVRNSNYVFHYKKNSLPCLDQEVMVNYNLSERIEESVSQNNNKNQISQKSNVQTSILDYVNTTHNTKSIDDVENRPEKGFSHSLYNYEEFDTNYSNNLTKNRKILGIIQDNMLVDKAVVSTPVRGNSRTMPPLDVSVIQDSGEIRFDNELEDAIGTEVETNNSNFDFDALSPVELGQKSSNEARPFRITMGTIKKYAICNSASYMEHADSLPSVLINNEPENNSSEDIGIFDDVEPELLMAVDSPIRYGKKVKRRQRLASITSTCSDDEKPKKKKKNAMTKVEEEEFEKWAAKFNSMCSEIEKHNLEIE